MAHKDNEKWHLGKIEGLVSEKKIRKILGLNEEKVEDKTTHISEDDIREGRGLAVLSYIPILCFIPLLSKTKNPFAYQHAKQGVMLFIVEILVLLSALFWSAALFIASLIAIVCVVYALQGKIWRIPYISEMSDKFDL